MNSLDDDDVVVVAAAAVSGTDGVQAASTTTTLDAPVSVGSSCSYMNQIEQALSRRRAKGNLRRLAYNNDDEEDDSDASVILPLSEGGGNNNKLASSSSHSIRTAMDFSSNDYLGLAQSLAQQDRVQDRFASVRSKMLMMKQQQHQQQSGIGGSRNILGATGSRLLSGDSPYFAHVERNLARFHNRKGALLCNSGYDANLSVVSSLPCNMIFYDEYIHNSIHMGMRLWQSASATDDNNNNSTIIKRSTRSFRHNSVEDLKRQLQALGKQQEQQQNQQESSTCWTIMILVESVYSMDGDVAPLREFLDLALEYDAAVLVDEAHALGVYGRSITASTATATATTKTLNNSLLPVPIPGTGLLAELELEHHPALFASIHTFGKGAGCHGAVLCCQDPKIKEYWVNFAYPFIYSTALPLHSLVTIQMSYETMTCPTEGSALRQQLQDNILFFRRLLVRQSGVPDTEAEAEANHNNKGGIFLMPSVSPIQALRVAGNQTCTEFCTRLYRNSHGTIALYPIKSPTVPFGQERVRIVMHAHNTTTQIQHLVQYLVRTLDEMQLLNTTTTTTTKTTILSKL